MFFRFSQRVFLLRTTTNTLKPTRRFIHTRMASQQQQQQDSKQSGILNWASKDGEFRRQVSSFRDCISDEPGSRFTPEP